MEVIRRYNYNRRDCWIDVKCESCGHEIINMSAYDDRNYWDNVIPNKKCPECDKSTMDLGLGAKSIQTKYNSWEVI